VDDPRTMQHVLALVAFSLLFGAGAWRAYRRSDVNQ
jgi:cbb3-type cytochrome oxidase subunit 3